MKPKKMFLTCWLPVGLNFLLATPLPLPFPELEFSFLGKLDLVVESLLSSELASLPESTEEFFLTLLGLHDEEFSSLVLSLLACSADFFCTSSKSWKQSAPHGSFLLNLSSGPSKRSKENNIYYTLGTNYSVKTKVLNKFN